MTDRTASAPHAPAHRPPRWVTAFNPLTRYLLRSGVPLGPNGLVTVRGRTSGVPRTTPIAIIELSGRRWIWAPWGEVNWVRNLRAAGRATITVRGRDEEVTARELDRTERAWFFRDVLGSLARSIRFGKAFIRIADQVDLDHPEEVAEDRRVFELSPVRRP